MRLEQTNINEMNIEKIKYFYKGENEVRNNELRTNNIDDGFLRGSFCYVKLFVMSVLLFSNTIFLNADDNVPTPFNPPKSNQNPNPLNNQNDQDITNLQDYQQEEKAQEANKMLFLNAIQNSFFTNKHKPQDNNLNILYKAGDTHKIRLRYAMNTTFIFDKDKIAYYSLGDTEGFEIQAPTKEGYNLSNILVIKPLLIGVDTNLTVIGESGKIYTFYLFSTHFTNSRNPAISVFISDNRKIGRIDVIPQEVKIKALKLKKLEELKALKANLLESIDASNETINNSTDKYSNNQRQDKQISDFIKNDDYTSKEIDDGKFIKIGDEVNHLFIDKNKIHKAYVQSPRTQRMWWSLWLYKKTFNEAKKLEALEIFDDGKYTYFKYDRSLSISKFPYPYKVVDGYDNPINSRIVGNYIIAEDVGSNWTLRAGDEYVCVSALNKPLKKDKE